MDLRDIINNGGVIGSGLGGAANASRPKCDVLALADLIAQAIDCRSSGRNNVQGILMKEDDFYRFVGGMPDMAQMLEHYGLYAFPLTDEAQSALGTSVTHNNYLFVSVGRELVLKMIRGETNFCLNVRMCELK